MDYFDSLPDEIVLKIIKKCIGNLHYRQTLKVLLFIRQTSRRFNILVDDIRTGKQITKLKNQYEYLTVKLNDVLSCVANNLGKNQEIYYLNEVKNLIFQGADINIKTAHNNTALMLAIACRDDEFSSYLINNGADITILATESNFPALQLAATFGCLKVVKLLINKNVDINQLSKNNVTALMQAAYNGKIEIVKLLLEHKAKLDHLDVNKWSALVGAAISSHLEIVRLLLDVGANVEIFIYNPELLDKIHSEEIKDLIHNRINKYIS